MTDGKRTVSARAAAPATEPAHAEALGLQVAQALVRQGALEIIAALNAANAAEPPSR